MLIGTQNAFVYALRWSGEVAEPVGRIVEAGEWSGSLTGEIVRPSTGRTGRGQFLLLLKLRTDSGAQQYLQRRDSIFLNRSYVVGRCSIPRYHLSCRP
jgi:hypothetical protein